MSNHARSGIVETRHPRSELRCDRCGQAHRFVELRRGDGANCSRCGQLLYKASRWGAQAPVAFAFAALVFAIPALALPFVTLSKFGSTHVTFLSNGVGGFWQHRLYGTSSLVLFTVIVAPVLLSSLVVVRWFTADGDSGNWLLQRVRQVADSMEHWAMPEVYVLGVLIAVVKLGDRLEVFPGPGLWSYTLMTLFTLLAWRSSAQQLGAHRASAGPDSPGRRRMLNRVLAFALAAAVMLAPANLLPVMRMTEAGEVPTEPTIFAGITTLAEEGFWGLAAIVFVASLLVPVLKLAGVLLLFRSAGVASVRNPKRLTQLHTALDFIGRWSMLDVFLVAFLCGTVRFGFLASVQPRSGIVAFAAVVVLTILATRSFDPRVFWTADRSASAQSS